MLAGCRKPILYMFLKSFYRLQYHKTTIYCNEMYINMCKVLCAIDLEKTVKLEMAIEIESNCERMMSTKKM